MLSKKEVNRLMPKSLFIGLLGGKKMSVWEERHPFQEGKGGADAELGVSGSLPDGEMVVKKGKKS